MTISQYDRVYVSSLGEYGRVSEIIKTGITGIVQYRVEFGDDRHRSGIFGAAFVQLAAYQGEPKTVRHGGYPGGTVVAMPRRLRLATVDGVQVGA